MHVLTRPFESLFLAAAVALFFVPLLWRRAEKRLLLKVLPETLIVLAPFLGLALFQNKAVTGSWTTLPEALSQYQYGVPAALTFQPPATPHRDLTPQQEMDYRMQRGFRGEKPETLASYLLRLEYRVRYYRFFFTPPLYIALVAFLFRLRRPRFLWVAAVGMLFALGTNFFPAFQTHYVAGIACLFVLMAVEGLDTLGRWNAGGQEAMRLVAALCAAHFLFWYGLHLAERWNVSAALRPYETWDAINHTNPERRQYVDRKLERIPGKLLVFVRYLPRHMFQDEWVYNAADIDTARVVFARDLGTEANEELRNYFPQRAVWLLEPDYPVPQVTWFPRPVASPFLTPR